jgi:hypothetical protein
MIEYMRRITAYRRNGRGPKTVVQWYRYWAAKFLPLFVAGLLLEGLTQQFQYENWTPGPASAHTQIESRTHEPRSTDHHPWAR